VQDFVFAVPVLPGRGEKYRASRFESVGGGPAATAAVAIARLGGRAQLAARVGADGIGALIVEELERYGVDCSTVRRFEGCASSVSTVLVDEAGERLIVNHLDARIPADAGWLPEPRSVGASAVLADVRWPEGARTALDRARRAGLPAILDADRPVPRGGDLLRCATHIAFSTEGLTEYASEPDPYDALARVAATVDAWCCVTMGEAGVFAIQGSSQSAFAAFRVAAVDTLGAGDVWHGAFALALAEGRNETEAVRFASAAAAVKVQRFGGRLGAPTRAEVDELLGAVA
jgi:sulfofructose kinase